MPPRPPAAHVARLPRFLGAAAADLRGGFWEQSVARAYYACLHATLALLSTVGLSPGTHGGAREMLGLHFVLTGLLPPEAGRTLSHLMTDRQVADYSVTAEITAPAARDAARGAVAFLRAALPLVAQRAPEAADAVAIALGAADALERAAAETG